MKTMRLNWDSWDLELDRFGNLSAISDETEYCAQSVANYVKLFTNDAYFFVNEGIPYFETVLGQKPPRSLVEAYVRRETLSVPLVADCRVLDYGQADRTVSGKIEVHTENGSKLDVSF